MRYTSIATISELAKHIQHQLQLFSFFARCINIFVTCDLSLQLLFKYNLTKLASVNFETELQK